MVLDRGDEMIRDLNFLLCFPICLFVCFFSPVSHFLKISFSDIVISLLEKLRRKISFCTKTESFIYQTKGDQSKHSKPINQIIYLNITIQFMKKCWKIRKIFITIKEKQNRKLYMYYELTTF